MSTPALLADFERLQRLGWFLVLVILLIVLGIVALVNTPAATLATLLVLSCVTCGPLLSGRFLPKRARR